MALEVVFLGTPEAAVATLDALQQSSHKLLAAVTAPDRPKGRGMPVTASPVKTRALEHGLRVLQPSGLKESAAQSKLAELGADVFVVAAYGFILPDAVLEMPRLGCINLHFSLLPRYRGAAPVQWALIDGLGKTGVTIMQIEAGLDSGPVLSQVSEPIRDEDTTGSLTERLASAGADLMVSTLDRVERGEVNPSKQDENLATYAPKITPAEARIDWSQAAEEIERRTRAFDPAPGAWTMIEGRRLKIWKAEVLDESPNDPPKDPPNDPGILAIEGASLTVGSGASSLRLIEVQPEGGRRMSVQDFLRGHKLDSEMRLS